MNREEFSALLRDVLGNIHDDAVLEKHPLNDVLPRPSLEKRKAENLRGFIGGGIHSLKPASASGNSTGANTLEWRYYRILHCRYIKGGTVTTLQKELGLGGRQERRMHQRAVSMLEEILWDRLNPAAEPSYSAPSPAAGKENDVEFAFPVSQKPLHLSRVVEETTALFLPQLRAHGGHFSVRIPTLLPIITADRVILRQILLHLFMQVAQGCPGADIVISASAGGRAVHLELSFRVKGGIVPTREELVVNELFAYWMDRLKANLVVEANPVSATFHLSLPVASQVKVLVVDDHEPALTIVQRHLSHTDIQVSWTANPDEVLSLAYSLRPDLILMDVMMPGTDGWEILQMLKSNPEIRQILVIICSVWDQPELAYTLGADGFLKKPIIQEELLDELARLNLMEPSAGSPPADF